MEELIASKWAVGALALAVLWWLEGVAPLFLERRDRGRRLMRHLTLAGINALALIPLLAVAALLLSTPSLTSMGLLQHLALSGWAGVLAALVVIDFWMYVWHRASHAVPLLWRFHRVHHGDPELDASSAFRFHTGEILISGLFRLILIPVAGVELFHLILYELVLIPVVLFHHSNVRVPACLDRGLRAVLVTPWMHWVHHSSRREETDSNFSSVLSVWDRMLGSFHLVADPRKIDFGLEEIGREESQTLTAMLMTPFRSTDSRGRVRRPNEVDRADAPLGRVP